MVLSMGQITNKFTFAVFAFAIHAQPSFAHRNFKCHYGADIACNGANKTIPADCVVINYDVWVE